jgi:hypothetical protein
MTITLEWWQWMLPAVFLAVVAGIYVGWKVMGLWTLGVFFSGLVAAKIGPKLDLIFSKLLSVMGQFAAIATDKPEDSVHTPTVQIASAWEPVATGALYLVLIIFSWWVARRLAGRGGGLLEGRLGGVFGGLASVLALSQAFDYWSDFVKRSGNNPTAVTPQISIGMEALPATNPLLGMATVAFGLFLLIVIVYTIWRAVKAAL